MPYERFTIGPSKGLVLAELDGVPNLLVVVGPNGAGKSTLLYELQKQRGQATDGTRVIYLNPNRPWRRTTFNAAILYNLPYSLRDLYERESFPGFQNYQPPGFVNSGLPRSADNIDDVQGLVKFSLARLESKRRRAISDEFDRRGGEVPSGTLRDAFAPLRELVDHLLPHLRFSRIDDAEGQNISCYFEKLDGPSPMLVEMDDLSSGEKAVFQLFLPFIEAQIERIITPSPDETNLVAIIDEPEIHLHPALQVAMLTYLRELAEEGRAQFIIATHSTTIMDVCEEDELYLLAPPISVAGGNQLMKLSATSERLDAVRQLTGSTYAVTRCRPIIYVEGERSELSRDITDERLIEMLVPEAKGWVVVPAHGRADVIEVARTLRDPTLTELPGMPVFALVDKDTTSGSVEEFVVTWPVCMVENLLLDSDAIWEVIAPHREKTGLSDRDAVTSALSDLAASRFDREIELRVQRRIPAFRVTKRITTADDLETLDETLRSEYEKYRLARGASGGIEAVRTDVKTEVEELAASGDALKSFHGKEILKAFFDAYGKRAGMSYSSFCYAIAGAATRHPRLRELVEIPVRKIRQFVPAELVSVLDDVVMRAVGEAWGIDPEPIRQSVRDARMKWEAEEEDNQDRREVRSQLSRLAVELKARGHDELQTRLLGQAVLFGT